MAQELKGREETTVRPRSSRFSFSSVCPARRQDPPCQKHSVNIRFDESLNEHFLQSSYVVFQALYSGTEQLVQVLSEGCTEVGNWLQSLFDQPQVRGESDQIPAKVGILPLKSQWVPKKCTVLLMHQLLEKEKLSPIKLGSKKIDKTRHFSPIFVWIWI